MFSTRTVSEIINYIDNLSHGEIDRILILFRIELPQKFGYDYTKTQKSNEILYAVDGVNSKGPFGQNLHEDLLQYIYDDYTKKFRKQFSYSSSDSYDSFTAEYRFLINSLTKDGYCIKNHQVQKLLPTEIEEAKTETELLLLLKKYNFATTQEHLLQATDNFVSGNWAGANSQFRTFIESLFIEITKKLLPLNTCNTASSAIQLLSKSVNPPFLQESLNEVETSNNKFPFIESFWKRLHPHGSHPGLSDKEDCEFRYYLSIVISYYLLRRLEAR